MYLKMNKRKNNRTYLSIVHGFHDKERGHSRTKTILSVGYLDDLEKTIDDPVAHYTNVAEEMNRNKDYYLMRSDLFDNRKRIKSNAYGLDQLLIESVFRYIGAENILKDKGVLNLINDLIKFKFLSLDPSSCDIKQPDTAGKDKLEIIKRLLYYKPELMSKLQDRSLGNSIDKNEDTYCYLIPEAYIRMNEYGKIPAVFTDSRCFPVFYDEFDSCAENKISMTQKIKMIQNTNSISKVLLVGDKGSCLSVSFFNSLLGNDGYIISRGLDPGDSEHMELYMKHQNNPKSPHSDIIGSGIRKKSINIIGTNARSRKDEIDEKYTIRYCEQKARQARELRNRILLDSVDLISNPGEYYRELADPASKYLTGLEFDPITNRVLFKDRMISIDRNKIDRERRFDGYQIIFTSETHQSDNEIVRILNERNLINTLFSSEPLSLDHNKEYTDLFQQLEVIGSFLAYFVIKSAIIVTTDKYDEKTVIDSLITLFHSRNMEANNDTVHDLINILETQSAHQLSSGRF